VEEGNDIFFEEVGQFFRSIKPQGIITLEFHLVVVNNQQCPVTFMDDGQEYIEDYESKPLIVVHSLNTNTLE